MINFFKKNRDSIIRALFLIPIILVGLISISHVVSWYGLTNPLSWAMYLSISVEVAAMVSLAAASVRIKGGVWFVFIVVTVIQFIGNIFYSYKEIDETSKDYKSWVELTTPIYESIGMDVEDEYTHKRTLALLSGGLLPLISLASLHFFIKYEKNKSKEVNSEDEANEEEVSEDESSYINDVEEADQKDDDNDVNQENSNIEEDVVQNEVISETVLNEEEKPITPIRTQKITDSDYNSIIENKKDRKFSVNVVEPKKQTLVTRSLPRRR